RTYGSSKKAIGFLNNFGAEIGAFASTWNFHENDLIVIGSNEKDMALAANNLIKTQGGLVVIKAGKQLASLPLQVGGIISTDSFDKVASNFLAITNSIVDSGCKFKRPYLIPLFLPFLALPSIRILYSGIVDVKKRLIIPPIN
ncbi:MAG: adenine deaminase C-terminal domain-containing protein, partial [Nitrosopumilaceae archaeon]